MTDPVSLPMPPTVDALRTRDGRRVSFTPTSLFLSPVHDARVARCIA